MTVVEFMELADRVLSKYGEEERKKIIDQLIKILSGETEE